MPTSTFAHLNTVVTYLGHVQPRSVLDIGVGNGKLGFLARDLLDVMLGERYHRRDWRVRIDGIEAFGDYIQAHQRAIYDEIHIGDAFEVIDRLGRYDLVMLGDVLEHFDELRARRLMDKCAAHAGWILLNIPLGEGWTQEAIYGNEYERHRSFWRREHFEPFSSFATYYELAAGDYGSFLIASADWAYAAVWEDVNRIVPLDARTAALEARLDRMPPNAASELKLAELLVGAGRMQDACDRLRRVGPRLPDPKVVQDAIAQLDEVVRSAK